MKRTHHRNELRKADAGNPPPLWVGSTPSATTAASFIDLRDREGKTQLVLDPENAELTALFLQLKPESDRGLW